MSQSADIALQRGLHNAKELALAQIAAASDVANRAFPGSDFTRSEILKVAQIIATNHAVVTGGMLPSGR